ncbi:MAG TPA: pentapeptide repeat-containing protein, partial [Azonexus sp.]|nr:pentapeptide repeat-containing protein [Azonexus sp.]
EFARLFRADFSGADLSAANLEAAKANFAWFVGARLNNANLQESKFFTVNFRHADLSGAFRRFTVFQDADFEACTACPTDW